MIGQAPSFSTQYTQAEVDLPAGSPWRRHGPATQVSTTPGETFQLAAVSPTMKSPEVIHPVAPAALTIEACRFPPVVGRSPVRPTVSLRAAPHSLRGRTSLILAVRYAVRSTSSSAMCCPNLTVASGTIGGAQQVSRLTKTGFDRFQCQTFTLRSAEFIQCRN
jgi:hypothetical protein